MNLHVISGLGLRSIYTLNMHLTPPADPARILLWKTMKETR